MANSVALAVQAELRPPQPATSLPSFPSLLGSGEDEEVGQERAQLVQGDKDLVEGGEEVILDTVTTSVPGQQAQQSKQSDNPFQCLDCGKSFRWSSRLTHHQRSHNNERPYRCTLCPKAFKGSSALLYHQRSHSGEKPYKCKECGKAFKRSSLLQVHQSVHTGVRTFVCPYCPLTFKWSSHFQYHLRQHTGECPYACDTCPKAFKNSSSLRRHKNVHLGLKPYTCSVCKKSFTQSTNLRQHMRIHTGERPYVCGECGRRFTHSSNLALHKNTHVNRVEVVVGADEMTSTSMLTGMVGFVGQEATDAVGVGMEEVFLSSTQDGQSQSLLRQLALAPSGEDVSTSRAIGTEVHLSTDTGASVLLYSCGSCSHAFGTQTDLEQHQSMHVDPEEHGGSEVAAAGPGMEVGHLLADIEEVVETTMVVENGPSTEVLLGLNTLPENSNTNVGTSQAQFDLLQSFTEATQSPESVQPEARTTWAGLSCGYCNKSFKTSGGLNRHVSLMHSLSSQSRSQFSCSACDRSFPLLSSLLTHQHSHTPEQRLLAEAEAEIVCPPSLSLSLPLPSSPSQADKAQEGAREIRVNIVTVGEEEEEEEDEQRRQQQQEEEQPPSKPTKGAKKTGTSKSCPAGERPYRCSECGKAFKGSSGLKYHMRDHTGERPYRCTECGKSFKRSSLLSIHQRVHTGVRAYQCPHCPLTFKWSSHYQYHLRQHTGERPYVCKECGKTFKNTSCLRRHSQMHSGLRPHTCSICSKSFSQISNLKQHERTHSGERPFQCTQCNKRFTHSSNLQLHLRTHSSHKDFKCPHCLKGFVMPSYLQRHIRTHGSGASLPASQEGAKEGVAVKASVGGVTTTTTLLNPITLETSGNTRSLIVSQPALNIPPNTSQNYFMVQTASGLQLIPLSSPAPTPPPPPPPPSQPQNILVMQCPSGSGSQSTWILVPTATKPPPAPEPQSLPFLQNIPALQAVLNPTQTGIHPFPLVSQRQDRQTRIVISNNSGDSAASLTRPPNSLLARPILGKSTRTARSRRGPKAKAALQKSPNPPTRNSDGPQKCPPEGRGANSNSNGSISLSTLPTPISACTSPASVVPPVGTLGATTAAGVVPVTTTAATTTARPVATQRGPRTEETSAENRLLLCFENKEQPNDVLDPGGNQDSLVFQFEGTPSTREVVGQEKSLVIQLKADVEGEGGADAAPKGRMMSLLHDWGGGEKPNEGAAGQESSQRKAYVLHFHTGAPDCGPSGATFGQGQDNGLQLSCPLQGLVPFGEEEEVVFELGAETKRQQENHAGVHMIALIDSENPIIGEAATGCNADNEGGGVSGGGGDMENIFQLENGEEIVIIEVSTSSLGEGAAERVGGDTSHSSEVKYESITAEVNHRSGGEPQSTVGAGPQRSTDGAAQS